MSFVSSRRPENKRRKEPEVEEMLEAYAAAVRAKDVDALVRLYEDDIRTFDLWSVWAYDGKPEFREMVRQWFISLPEDEMVEVEFAEVRTQSGDGIGGLSAFTTFRAVSPDGKELRSMNNRLTWVLRKDAGGAWKIAHEHTSAPAGEGGKVQLQRQL
jgi:uncharacterized protein (TIGR02246 family)